MKLKALIDNIRIIGISFGFIFGLFFFCIFYQMLFTGNTNVLLMFNEFGEFWIEFFAINVVFVFITITCIIEWKKPIKEVRKENGKNN